jgi:hypothetical protein
MLPSSSGYKLQSCDMVTLCTKAERLSRSKVNMICPSEPEDMRNRQILVWSMENGEHKIHFLCVYMFAYAERLELCLLPFKRQLFAP